MREWGRAGHEVTVVCQERHPERFDLGGATVVRPGLPDGLLPVFVLDRYEGLRPKLLQEWTDEEKRRYVDANAAALRSLGEPDLLLRQPRADGRARGLCRRRPAGRQGPRLRARVRDARAARARGVGEGVAACGRGDLRRLRAHPPRARGDRRRGRARARGAAGRRRGRVPAAAAGRGARRPPRRGARGPAEPGERGGAAARRGQRRPPRGVPRRRRADGRLLRQAPLQQGCPRPPRGAPRASTPAP